MDDTQGSTGPQRRVFTAKGLATRTRIVTAAAELIFQHGVVASGLEDLQRAAGVSGSQVYHYFDDKQAVVRAVVAHQAAAALQDQEHLGPLDSLGALRAWAAFHVDGQRAAHCVGGCRLGSLVGQLAEEDPAARDLIDSGFVAWEQPVVEGLRAMRDRGELRASADPQRLGVAALATLQGGLLLTQVQRSVAPLEAALSTFLEHVESLMTPVPTGKVGDEGSPRPRRRPGRTRST